MAEIREIRIQCDANKGFQTWMSQFGGSLVLSTYQAGKVALLGWDGRQVTVHFRSIDKPMGVAVHGEQLLIASRRDVTLFTNAQQLAWEYRPENPGMYDTCYLPRTTWHTGELQVHDVVLDEQGILMVNTRFSCLARPSFMYHFEEVWRPPFITDLVPEDRCHLNGVALVDRKAAYVTALGKTDSPGGWRENKAQGGIVMDVRNNQIILDNLCMPHSPRWYKECLWLLNSGRGELWVVNPENYDVKVVYKLPGYLRGLDFVGDCAIIGMSKIREKHYFGNLPVQNKNQILTCGVAVIDVITGNLVGMFEFTSGCEEIYEVRALPRVRRAALLTADKPGCHEAITTRGESWWIRPSSENSAGKEKDNRTGDNQEINPNFNQTS